MNKNNVWYYNYCYKEKINIYDYFNDNEITFLRRLGINIEKKLYTEKEFDTFDELLFKYYKTNKNDKIIYNNLLKSKGIFLELYINFLKTFKQISIDYDL